jgi:hypothetical protein
LAGKLQVSIAVFTASGALLSAAYFDIDSMLVALAVSTRRIVSEALAEQRSPLGLRGRAPLPITGLQPPQVRV